MPDPRKGRDPGYNRPYGGNPEARAEAGLPPLASGTDYTRPSHETVQQRTPVMSVQKPGVVSDEEAYRRMLREFIARMQAPLDDNDPEVQRYTAMATNASQRAAQASGVRGGMGVAATQRNVAAGMVPLTQFRQEQARMGMGMLGQNLSDVAARQLQQQQLDQRQKQFDQARFDDLQKMRAAYDQSRGSSLGSMVGGGLGLLAGGLATYATGGAAAPAIPAFMQAGAGIGGSLGAQSAGGMSDPYNWGNF